MAPRAENGTYNGTAADRAAENGTTELAPVPKNGTDNGTGTDLAAKNGTAELAPRAENGTHYGTAADRVAKNGTAEMAPLPKVGGMGGGNTQQSGTAVNGADYRCRWVRQGCSPGLLPGLSPFTSFPGGEVGKLNRFHQPYA